MARRAGGQAVFEGVMMRGTDRWAVAVRTPRGDIEVLTAALPELGGRWRKVPFVRGLLTLAEALPLGFRALRWSSVHGLGQRERKATPTERAMSLLMVVLVVGAVVTIPVAAASWLTAFTESALLFNVVEGALSIAVLVAYIAAVGRLDEVRRLFQNHGAEHKVVTAYEEGVPLTPEWANRYSTRHVRCGTSFLLVVGVVSVLFYVLLGRHPLPTLLATRIMIIPLVAAVSAELQIRASENLHRPWVRFLVRPGLALQRLTTREPTMAQLEVAIVALKAALTDEERAEVESWEVPRSASGSVDPVPA
jgi:uncharacterized protein YqhQ